MLAAVFHGGDKPLRVERVPDPLPQAGSVVLEVKHAGICGSDLHMAKHEFVAPGTIFGHEFAGTVAAIGAGAPVDLKLGARVTVNPYYACNDCAYCDEGHLALCSGGRCVGTSVDLPGAYAEYVSVPVQCLQQLPSGATFEEGALVEPLAVAYHAVRLAHLRKEDRVLVMGGGPVGLAVTLMCKMAGVTAIAVSEPVKERREQAVNFGAILQLDPTALPLADQLKTAFDGPPSVIIECAGARGRIQDALSLIAPRGLVVVPGACMTADEFHPAVGLMKEARIQFSMTYTNQDFEAVVELIAKHEIDALKLRTRNITLDEVPEAFATLASDPRHVKVMIDPHRS